MDIEYKDYKFLLENLDSVSLLRSNREGLIADAIKTSDDPEIKFNVLLYSCLDKEYLDDERFIKGKKYLINGQIKYLDINKFITTYVGQYNLLNLLNKSPLKENLNKITSKTKGLLITMIINQSNTIGGLAGTPFAKDKEKIIDYFNNFEPSKLMIKLFKEYYARGRGRLGEAGGNFKAGNQDMIDFLNIFFRKLSKGDTQYPEIKEIGEAAILNLRANFGIKEEASYNHKRAYFDICLALGALKIIKKQAQYQKIKERAFSSLREEYPKFKQLLEMAEAAVDATEIDNSIKPQNKNNKNKL